MKLPHSVGFIGGRPSSSYYFVGNQDKTLLYLDPHYSQSYVPMEETSREKFDLSTYFCPQLQNMRINDIDESLALGFFCRDFTDFLMWVSLVNGLTDEFACEKLLWFEETREDNPVDGEHAYDDWTMDDWSEEIVGL
eukprot:TRINITY_DN8316_c0_g1_i1.p1 TRINITY_DN8316_c0_g1~~TRINITY_DN8316_c0_g1_i1.p1  ORF type:complete len:137 (+),score=31.96 TRINITY_DN8316_c0_g1_i1:332-742(+)